MLDKINNKVEKFSVVVLTRDNSILNKENNNSSKFSVVILT